MQTRHGGFTLIEMLAAVAVIAILALIAVPGFQDRIVRTQIVEAVPLADVAKRPIAAAWAASAPLPADNAEAGLPPPEKIVSTLVSAVAVEQGAVHVRFGNQANGALRGRVLSFRPAVVEDAPVVPVSWICGHAPVPDKMSARGPDRTDVPRNFLPLNCR
jgi:type IV pilus assembly protein PilA